MTAPEQDFETRAVQSGLRTRQDFLSTSPVIYPSSTFTYDSAVKTHAALDPFGRGFAYTRNANPTTRALEEAMASLEETEDAVAFASGMAAVHAAILATGVRPPQAIMAAQDLYGVSRTLLRGLFADMGFDVRLVNGQDFDAVEAAFRQTQARVLCFEPVSNPLVRVCDVPRLIELAHEHGAMAIVDNTFLSPYLFCPARHGADMVVESATKYLGGHGDVMAGVVACDADLARVVRSLRTATGGILGPFEAWLVLRGIRTLALRVRRHCENAMRLAEWLQGHPDVQTVDYPGMESHPGHEWVSRNFRDGLAGGIVAFDTALHAARVESFLDALTLAVPGTSLGDVETLVLHPASSSHRTLTPEERSEAGIGEGLFRVSVGLEGPGDIIRDFSGAFDSVRAL